MGCTQKYSTYHIIEKESFKPDSEHNPTTRKMYGTKKVKEYLCVGQWLFSSNAQKLAEGAMPTLLSHTCPGKKYLLNAKVTNRWWTTIIYSRSCYIVEATCPQVVK